MVCAAAIAVFTLWIGPATIDGDSMAPTLADGAVVLVDRVSYRLGSVAAGDVILLQSPGDPAVVLAKRVAGVGGDRVEFDAFGRLSVNGRPVAPSAAVPVPFDCGLETVTVPPGCYFVAGDNRISSTDSRDFGPVPAGRIVGRVRAVLWPPAAIGAVR